MNVNTIDILALVGKANKLNSEDQKKPYAYRG
jgi:hypothetical protein